MFVAYHGIQFTLNLLLMMINQRINEKHSDKVFKFGDEKVFKSLTLVMLPAKIYQKAVKKFFDVIDCELPLLLR